MVREERYWVGRRTSESKQRVLLPFEDQPKHPYAALELVLFLGARFEEDIATSKLANATMSCFGSSSHYITAS